MVIAANLQIEWGDCLVGCANVGCEVGFCDVFGLSLTDILLEVCISRLEVALEGDMEIYRRL